MQMVLYPHLATAGVVSTSVPSWVETGRVCTALILTFSYIFLLFSPLWYNSSQNPTPAGFSTVPPIQTEWPIKLAQGEQMSAQKTLFTLSYTSHPPALLSFLCDVTYFHWLSSFALSLCIHSLCCCTFLFSCVHVPPSQMVNRLVLQTTNCSRVAKNTKSWFL